MLERVTAAATPLWCDDDVPFGERPGPWDGRWHRRKHRVDHSGAARREDDPRLAGLVVPLPHDQPLAVGTQPAGRVYAAIDGYLNREGVHDHQRTKPDTAEPGAVYVPTRRPDRRANAAPVDIRRSAADTPLAGPNGDPTSTLKPDEPAST